MKNLTYLGFCMFFFFSSCSYFSKIGIKERLLEGKCACVEFHETPEINFGTINTGKTYELKWRNGQMHTWGPNGKSGRNLGTSYPLSKVRLNDNKLSIWGFKAYYDDEGIVYHESTKTSIGKIYSCEPWEGRN